MDSAEHGQRWRFPEGIQADGLEVRDQHHVAALSLGEAITRAVEPNSLREDALVELLHWNRKVMKPTDEIEGFEVNEPDPILLAATQYFTQCRHLIAL